MKRSLFLLVLLATLIGWVSAADAKMKVVATIPDLAAIARELGGDRVEVTSLALPTQDPHFVDARPSLALQVMRADLLLVAGLDLEIGWLPTLQTGSRNPKVQVGARGFLDCSQFVSKLDVPATKVDRAEGDIHPGGNPHYLYDPRQVALVAAGIAGRLSELDPGNEAVYKKNLKDFQARLDAARARWEKRMASFRGAPVIVYHRSFAYFVDWLGIVEVAEIEPKPGIPPTSKHIARVLGLGRQKGVKVVLQESYYPGSTSELLAQKLPGQLVKVTGGCDFRAGETWIDHMDHVIDQLAKALGDGK